MTIFERCMIQKNDKMNYTAGIIIKHMFENPDQTDQYKNILMKMLLKFNENTLPLLRFINNIEEGHEH